MTDKITANPSDAISSLGNLAVKNPAAYEQLMTDLNNGDGNAAINDIHKDYKNGDISLQDEVNIASITQQYVNGDDPDGLGKPKKIGGVINKTAKKEIESDTGGYNPIAKGKSRSLIGFEKFVKGVFGGIASVIGDIL